MERDRPRPLALIGVFIGAAGFAASLTAVYGGMRDVMINAGGACASGGPYQIAPGQECESAQIGLLMGGIFAMLFFGAILLGATGRWGDGSVVGVGLVMWAGLFGALGFNFIQLGVNPPSNFSGSTAGWTISGVVFWAMALGGLIPGLALVAAAFREEQKTPEERSMFSAPIVRANVNFERNMPGDPAFGMTDPNAGQAPPVDMPPSTTGDFVDPVTGERHGSGDEK